MIQVEIVHEDATLRIGVARNLSVLAWFDAPGLVQIRAMERARQAFVARHHGNVGSLDVVVSGTPRFSDEIRSEVARIMRDPRLQGTGTAHVVLVDGLLGTTARTFLSTAILLARPATPHKVFGDLRAAAAWLAPLVSRIGEAWTADDILAVQADVTRVTRARAAATS